MTDFSQHPNYSQIESERALIFAKLATEQAKRSTYLQCLITPLSSVDGSTLTSFDTSRKPSDETEDWTALDVATTVAAGTRCQYYIHRYDGPSGSGFVLGCRVEWDGYEWRYEEHDGPEERSAVFDRWIGHQEGTI